MKAYSVDLRQKVIDAYNQKERGHSDNPVKRS